MCMKGKTPEVILSEFERFRAENYPSCIGIDYDADDIKDWLRSSIQSLLLHVMGEMPKLKTAKELYPDIPALPNEEYAMACEGKNMRNQAITDCLAVIQSTIDSIKE